MKEGSAISQHIISYDGQDCVSRILRFDHLISMIKDKQLLFPKVASWDDTHESFLFKSTIKIKDRDFGNIFENFNFEDKYFGLSWSYWEETDALWRIYSPDRDRVKIRVNVGQLQAAILAKYHPDTSKDVLPALGRVVYIRKEDWDIMFAHEIAMNFEYFMTFNNLFIKRMEFEYENEFRVIIISLNPLANQKFITIPIDPQHLIEEVVFDPRISDKHMEQYSEQLSALGITNFRKSNLYDPVNLKLNQDDQHLNHSPLKVVNYYDKTNALRMVRDAKFEGLVKNMLSQIKEKSD